MLSEKMDGSFTVACDSPASNRLPVRNIDFKVFMVLLLEVSQQALMQRIYFLYA
jgi:hypothetical protein